MVSDSYKKYFKFLVSRIHGLSSQNIPEREGGRQEKALIFLSSVGDQLWRGWGEGGGGRGPGSRYLIGFILQLLLQVLLHLELVLQLPHRVVLIVLILRLHVGIPIFCDPGINHTWSLGGTFASSSNSLLHFNSASSVTSYKT